MRWKVPALLFLSACGYSLKPDTLALAGDPAQTEPKADQRFFIPLVDNVTVHTGIETQLTTSIRENIASIKGVRVVSDERAADYLILVTLNRYSRLAGSAPVTGSTATEVGGGLLNTQSTSANIHLDLSVEVKLLQRVNDLRRIVWTKNFIQGGDYDADQRFTEREGASTAPYVNNSRELIEARLLAENFARQIRDQLTQDF